MSRLSSRLRLDRVLKIYLGVVLQRDICHAHAFRYNGGCVVESFLIVGLRLGVDAGVSSPSCLIFFILPGEEVC